MNSRRTVGVQSSIKTGDMWKTYCTPPPPNVHSGATQSLPRIEPDRNADSYEISQSFFFYFGCCYSPPSTPTPTPLPSDSWLYAVVLLPLTACMFVLFFQRASKYLDIKLLSSSTRDHLASNRKLDFRGLCDVYQGVYDTFKSLNSTRYVRITLFVDIFLMF